MKFKLFLLALISVFAPVKAAIITVGVLIFADLITGVLAAKKRKEPISSSGLRRTASKLIIFEAVILLAFLTEKFLTGDLVPMCKIATAFIGLVEYTSIIENLNCLSGTPIFDRLLSILNKKKEDLQ